MAERAFNGSFLLALREKWSGYDIKLVKAGLYSVRPPNSAKAYSVTLSDSGWSCTCTFSKHRKAHCNHVKAAETALLPEPEKADLTVLDPVPENHCPHCGTDGATKAGVRKNKNYDNQIYKCRSCKRRFSANLGFEKCSAPPDIMIDVANDFFDGKSTGTIARNLKEKLKYSPSQQTVSNWIRRISVLLGTYSRSLNPCLGDKCRMDGTHVPAFGKGNWVHSGIDDATRYWIAYQMTPNKATDDVSRLFRDVAKTAGKIMTLTVTDSDPAYAAAHKKEWKPRNYTWKPAYHHPHTHFTRDINNNLMERFNGTIKSSLKPKRGYKKGSPIIEGLRVYYNHIRPHEGIGDLTPGEAAGIIVNGPKWRTLVQHARLYQIKSG